VDCELPRLKEHHFTPLLLLVLAENGGQDGVDLELIAGQLAQRTDPFGVGRCRRHYHEVVKVETLEMPAE
jgi:hypothetical protein